MLKILILSGFFNMSLEKESDAFKFLPNIPYANLTLRYPYYPGYPTVFSNPLFSPFLKDKKDDNKIDLF